MKVSKITKKKYFAKVKTIHTLKFIKIRNLHWLFWYEVAAQKSISPARGDEGAIKKPQAMYFDIYSKDFLYIWYF